MHFNIAKTTFILVEQRSTDHTTALLKISYEHGRQHSPQVPKFSDEAQRAKFDSCMYNQGFADKSRNAVVLLYLVQKIILK